MINKALGILSSASDHAASIDYMLEFVHWFMFALFIIWITYFAITLYKFSKSRNPKASYAGVTNHASTYLEIGVVCIEAFLLLGLAFPLWAHRVKEFPAEKDATNVRVIAEQFAWNIYYPGADGVFGKRDISFVASDNPLGIDKNDAAAKDDIVTLNQMHIPVNKPVIIHITSKDVIHSFTLRNMRITQDAIPGLDIPLWFTPTKTSAQLREEDAKIYEVGPGLIPPGKVAMEDIKNGDTVIVAKLAPITEEVVSKMIAAGLKEAKLGPENPMEIACAQLCGIGHARMRGLLTVDSQEDYDKWMKEQTPGGGGGGYE
jgi:cytochrome c oxidase subunit 2